jgi:hypothetical protein
VLPVSWPVLSSISLTSPLDPVYNFDALGGLQPESLNIMNGELGSLV